MVNRPRALSRTRRFCPDAPGRGCTGRRRGGHRRVRASWWNGFRTGSGSLTGSATPLSKPRHAVGCARLRAVADYDLLIRGGTLVDGTGAPPRTADVAVTGGRIAEVGTMGNGAASAARLIDADAARVRPGFVDIHTHYDGPATWSHQLAPS